MADFLIHHLEKKGQQHSSLAMLVNQWGFDQHLIPKALQNVGSLFPHYSRHDESHSKQILVNIERLLADNLSLLTATDTWLLLEAAYWHDIGMVVPQKALEDALAEQGFKDYLAELSRNEHHELHQLASQFDASNPCQCFAGAHSPVDAVDKFRQLMAEWFRRQHARRASEVVQSPWQTIGLSSPRTELIPSRLFRLLGQICLMHGSDFDTMMERLPFREAGMAKEDCHPRFVACLLRLGDLLDLDDNRFCPVMQNIAGDNRPALSKAHEAKHQSIRHLRMDRDRIEVSAECEDIDSYLETWKWFDWLKQEMQQQMSRWSDIVPHRKLGLLPTLGDLKVTSKNQKILRPGQRPQFRIEGKNAIELLQGSNLYSNQFAFIQELVQNAIDATLIRIWLTDGKKDPDTWENPLNSIPQQILHDPANAVEVDIVVTYQNREEGTLNCTVTISDNGTGVREEDLSYMLEIGRSQDNIFRKRIIQGMPEWMRPAGVFGIGLQSAFLEANIIRLKTRNIFDNKFLVVDMYNPMGKELGLVKITEGYQGDCFGQEFRSAFSVSFTMKERNVSNIRMVKNAGKIRYEPVDSFDSFPEELNEILDDLIDGFDTIAMPSISVTITSVSGERFSYGNHNNVDDVKNKMVFISKPMSMIVEKLGRVSRRSFPARRGKIYYRGRKTTSALNVPMYDFNVNIFSESAGYWLKLDKSEVKPQKSKELNRAATEALFTLLDQEDGFMRTDNQGEDRAIFIALLEKRLYPHKQSSSYLLWAGSEIKPLNGYRLNQENKRDSLFIKNLFDGGDLFFKLRNGCVHISTKPPISGENGLCDFYDIEGDLWFDLILNELILHGKKISLLDSCEKNHGGFLAFHENDRSSETYKVSSLLDAPYTQKTLASYLMECTSMYNERPLLYVNNNEDVFKDLVIDPRYIVPGGRNIFNSIIGKSWPDQVILPFRILAGVSYQEKITAHSSDLEKLYQWVFGRLKYSQISISEIREKYQNLIDHIDNNLMPSQGFGKEWAQARGLPPPPDEPSLDSSPVST